MKKDYFWFITLCLLFIAVARFGLSVPLRAALAANGGVILFDVIKEWRNKRNGNEA